MRFLKENSYDILRLYINQISITIFSLVLYFSVTTIENEAMALKLKVGISVFATLFFLALIYTAAWEWGAKDKIRIDAGRMSSCKCKGFLMGIAANSVNFLLSAICLVTACLYFFGGFESARSIEQVFTLLLRMTNAMYIGFLQGIFSGFESNAALYYLLQAIGFFVAPLLPILATHIGYVFGLKNIKIISPKKSTKK